MEDGGVVYVCDCENNHTLEMIRAEKCVMIVGDQSQRLDFPTSIATRSGMVYIGETISLYSPKDFSVCSHVWKERSEARIPPCTGSG